MIFNEKYGENKSTKHILSSSMNLNVNPQTFQEHFSK